MGTIPDSARTRYLWMEDKEDWFEGNKEDTIFRSKDKHLNGLHEGTNWGNRTMRKRDVTFEEGFTDHSPYPQGSNIGHKITVNDNINEESVERLLSDENGSNNLEWDDEGSIYQVNMYETVNLEGESITGDNVGDTRVDTDLLGLHAVIYEDGSGDDHLLHWDPCQYDSETGDKMKFLEEDGQPNLTYPVDTSENNSYFESNATRDREEGLEEVHETLIEGSDEIYEEATEEMIENSDQRNNGLDYSDTTYEKAWQGERWRAFADAVRGFNESKTRGYTPEESQAITF